MSRIKRVKVATREFDAVLKQQDDSELDQSDRNKVGSSSPTSSRGRREGSSSRNGESKKPNKDDKPDIKEAKSDDVQETDSKEFLEGSKEAAFLSHLPFDEMSSLEAECFSDLQGPSSLALVDTRNRILKMWFENPKKQLTEYAVQKTEAPYNSDPALVLRTHTFLERHGFINCGMYERITLIPNPPSADTQRIKQEPEETKPQVDELPLDPDGAGAMYSLYKDHQIKEEMVISPNVFHTQTYDYSNMQKIKQNPEETQHHVFEVPLDLDGAYSLGDVVKEEKVIGPTVSHTLTFEYSSVAVSNIKKLSNKEETEKQTAEETLQRTEDTDEVAQQITPNVKSKLYDISVSVDSKQEVSKEAVGTKHKVKSNKTAKIGPNSVTVTSDDKDYASNRVSVTVICDRLLEHSCDICEYSTNNTRDFNSHLKAHAAAEKYNCDMCSYTTTIRWSLIRHLKSHCNDRPFVCKTCDAKFKHRSILKQHLKIHTDEKPFSCDVCYKSFNKKNDLDRHSRIHTGEKPFSCDVCNKSFNQRATLVTHQRIHTGEKPFSCDVCHGRFSGSSNLRRHRRKRTCEKT